MGLKKHNWDIALCDYINACQLKAFEWGVFDCGLFIVGAVEAMTGLEVNKPVKSEYQSRREAVAIMRKWRVSEQMRLQLNAFEVGFSYRQNGDVFCLEEDGLEKTMLFYGQKAYAPSVDKPGLLAVDPAALPKGEGRVLRFL